MMTGTFIPWSDAAGRMMSMAITSLTPSPSESKSDGTKARGRIASA